MNFGGLTPPVANSKKRMFRRTMTSKPISEHRTNRIHHLTNHSYERLGGRVLLNKQHSAKGNNMADKTLQQMVIHLQML